MTFADGLKHILAWAASSICLFSNPSAASKSLDSASGPWAYQTSGLAVVALSSRHTPHWSQVGPLFCSAGAPGVIAAAIAGIGALAAQVMGAFNTKAPMAEQHRHWAYHGMMGEAVGEMVLPLERDNVIADSGVSCV